MKGKIVLVPFPFTDLTSTKLRPALVLLERELDIVVVFISSKIPSFPSTDFILVDTDHPEYGLTGLKVPSVIRPDKVCTLLKELVIGELGEIGFVLKREMNNYISEYYMFKDVN